MAGNISDLLVDDVTGLPRRRVFAERATEELVFAERRGSRTGLALVSLRRVFDRGNPIGRPAPDELLRSVAERLVAHVRRTDTVGRLEAATFGVLLPACGTPESGLRITKRLASLFWEPVSISELDVTVLVSTSLAVSPDHADTFEGLYATAHSALEAHLTFEGRRQIA